MNEKTAIEDGTRTIYAAVRSELNNLSIPNIRNTAAAAGIDVTRIPSRSEQEGGMGSRAEVLPAIDRLFGEMSLDQQITAIRILAERLMGTGEQAARVIELLSKHGFVFTNGTFVPTGLLDDRERKFLPEKAATEVSKAMSRLVDGDETGAITAACGAVDLITYEIYRRDGIGNESSDSFTARVNTCINHFHIYDDLRQEYMIVGMSEDDAKNLVRNIRKATTHAAEALQRLRTTMGDVHGSKPADETGGV